MKNKKKEKRFEVDIDLKFTEVCFAKDRQKAMEQVVASFLDEYNFQNHL